MIYWIHIFILLLSGLSGNVLAALDYLHAAPNVGFNHWHIKRTAGKLVPDQNSSTGYSWIDVKVKTISETNIIPLEKGHGFDIHLLLFKLPKDLSAVSLITQHPTMKLPSGKTISTQNTKVKAYNKRGFPEISFSYFLDEDYELVPGDWHLSFSYMGSILFEITFTMVNTIPNKQINTDNLLNGQKRL